MALITLDRALQQIPQAQECDYPTITAIINGVSTFVETYCQRTFAQATYDELHSFQQASPFLYVNNPPINSVNWVRSSPIPAFWVQYLDSTNQTQLATVEVTSTAVVLKRVYNNVSTTDGNFTFASYPTVAALQTAINTVSGWTCTTSSQFLKWQTSDLYEQGAYSARNITAPILTHWWYLPNYRVNYELGEIYTLGSFVPGRQNYRVSYVGGYATIPDDLQQAVAELVRLVFASTKLNNPLMQSETLDKYSYTRAATTALDQLSYPSKQTLSNYRIMSVSRWGV